ncbi:MAG: transcription initiation factor TFIIIB, Brf1 subunit/Transcription initiation factor TFIIB [Haloquadratum sp. J07HQX50]|nr:MAG: transcription initiation factor TFIIIB, Brf1 subunit/Transcription initiation factor TFIIB [Haloquadratum sp. J07HQX50]
MRGSPDWRVPEHGENNGNERYLRNGLRRRRPNGIECDGRVTTNAVETVCEDCGLVIDEQRIDHGPEWRAYDDEECERTGAPLTAARHDRGLSTEIGRGTDAKGNKISEQKRRRLARIGVNRLVVVGGRKRNGISPTDWAK